MSADYRGVSPFTNHLPPDLFQGFVGRSRELDSLRSAYLAGVRGMQVVGPAGSGKTSLARVFTDRFKEQFPGGVSVANASWAESPDALFRRVLPDVVDPGPRLLVVDDAEALDELVSFGYPGSLFSASPCLNTYVHLPGVSLLCPGLTVSRPGCNL